MFVLWRRGCNVEYSSEDYKYRDKYDGMSLHDTQQAMMDDGSWWEGDGAIGSRAYQERVRREADPDYDYACRVREQYGVIDSGWLDSLRSARTQPGTYKRRGGLWGRDRMIRDRMPDGRKARGRERTQEDAVMFAAGKFQSISPTGAKVKKVDAYGDGTNPDDEMYFIFNKDHGIEINNVPGVTAYGNVIHIVRR